jgi:hypothetical protein
MISQALGNNRKMRIESAGENEGTEVRVAVYNYAENKS